MDPKRQKRDGNLDAVDKSILLAAQDQEKWIAERRKRWPTKERIAQKKAEEKVPVPEPPKPKRMPVCRYFARGKCNLGDKCRFSHQIEDNARIYKRFEAPVKSPLFVKLVQSDHDKEDERFLDFVIYLNSVGI